jgi:hypothetical protein
VDAYVVATQRDLEAFVAEAAAQGYRIQARAPASLRLVRHRTTEGAHIVVFLLTGWLTWGLGNLLYRRLAGRDLIQVHARRGRRLDFQGVRPPPEVEARTFYSVLRIYFGYALLVLWLLLTLMTFIGLRQDIGAEISSAKNFLDWLFSTSLLVWGWTAWRNRRPTPKQPTHPKVTSPGPAGPFRRVARMGVPVAAGGSLKFRIVWKRP